MSPFASVYGCDVLDFLTIYSWLDDTEKVMSPICLYYVKYNKFAQWILRKIIKIVANRCQILRLKCTEFNLGWGQTQT